MFLGKRPEMDVGFGLCPDKCYSKLVKAKFVTRNSSQPAGHLIQSDFITVWRRETPAGFCTCRSFCWECFDLATSMLNTHANQFTHEPTGIIEMRWRTVAQIPE